MKHLTDKEFALFEQLVGLTQEGLKKALSTFLQTKYKNIVETKDYILAEGNIPIALVAHMDTVFSAPPSEVFYDTARNVIWGNNGLGADDRAGIFIMMRLIQKGLRPHIILTTDEERGCLGAMQLAKIEQPFEDLRYIIQLDRRNEADCVFYDCDNPDFEKYVETFGFVTAIGTLSDICEICPAWEIAGVNLSVGYVDEHTLAERLYVHALLTTLERVKKMLTVSEMPEKFKYIPIPYPTTIYNGIKYNFLDDEVVCAFCLKSHSEEECFPVRTVYGGFKFYCPDCIGITDYVEWCEVCGNPYELVSKLEEGVKPICHDCKKYLAESMPVRVEVEVKDDKD